MKRYCTLQVDPNYLWQSPVEKEIHGIVSAVTYFLDFLLIKFLSKKYKKIYMYLTDDEKIHGQPYKFGFFFFVNQEQIIQAKKEERTAIIAQQIENGLIKMSGMGELYDWTKEDVEFLFKPIKESNFVYQDNLTKYFKNPSNTHKIRLIGYCDANIDPIGFNLFIEVYFNKNHIQKKLLKTFNGFTNLYTEKKIEWLDENNVVIHLPAETFKIKYDVMTQSIFPLILPPPKRRR